MAEDWCRLILNRDLSIIHVGLGGATNTPAGKVLEAFNGQYAVVSADLVARLMGKGTDGPGCCGSGKGVVK